MLVGQCLYVMSSLAALSLASDNPSFADGAEDYKSAHITKVEILRTPEALGFGVSHYYAKLHLDIEGVSLITDWPLTLNYREKFAVYRRPSDFQKWSQFSRSPVSGQKTILDIARCVDVSAKGTDTVVINCNDCRDYVDRVYRYLIGDCECGQCNQQNKKVDKNGKQLYGGKLDHPGNNCDTCKANNMDSAGLTAAFAAELSAMRKTVGLTDVAAETANGPTCELALDSLFDLGNADRDKTRPAPQLDGDRVMLLTFGAWHGKQLAEYLVKKQELKPEVWNLLLSPNIGKVCAYVVCVAQATGEPEVSFGIGFKAGNPDAAAKLREEKFYLKPTKQIRELRKKIKKAKY